MLYSLPNHMKNHRSRSALFLLSLFLLTAHLIAWMPSHVFADGIGVSPGRVEVTDLLVNSRIVRHVTVSRTPTTADTTFHVGISGPAAAAIAGPSEITIPQGEQTAMYRFSIDTQGMSLGTLHEAVLTFSPSSPGGKKNMSGSETLPAIMADVAFTVTDQTKRKLEIQRAIVQEIQEGQPLTFSYTLTNRGNAPDNLSHIMITVADQLQPKNPPIQKKLLPSSAPIEGFSDKTELVKTDIDLPKGRYLVTIAFYDTDKRIYEKENYPLQVSGVDGTMPPLVSHPARPASRGSLPLILAALIGVMALAVFALQMKARASRASSRPKQGRKNHE